MEFLRIRSPALLVSLLAFAVALVLPHVSGRRIIVGGNQGWSTTVNYTVWASEQHFYFGDWLYFVYDRNQINILEVNSTDYATCNSDHPVHNWTTGAGRDVVPLNVTKRRYFISGKGFCFSGMKLTVKPEKVPPPPRAAPVKSNAYKYCYRTQFVLPVAFAIGALWDSFLRVM